MIDLAHFEPFGDKFTAEDFAKLEQEVGYELPAEFKNFFVAHGGMALIAQGKVDVPPLLTDFNCFCGKRGEFNPLDDSEPGVMRIGSVKADHFPPGSIVFAEDHRGNAFIMNMFFHKIRCRWYSKNTAEVVDVASSFCDFISKIEILPYED